MSGSTSDPAVPRESRARLFRVLAIAAGIVGGLTALVFLMRAGGDPDDAATWPITWELRSSDNGTLFQFWQDVAAGRPLDWSFSPQVYVFPELPLSGLAFLATGGNLSVYYLVVAVLNQVCLFLVLAALARRLWPTAGARATALRAGVAVTPLLLLPLVGTSWVLSFHLAPTYYVGMYLALLAAPLLLLVQSRASVILVGAGLALTVASNPLTVVFAAPGLVAVAAAALARNGPRGLLRPARIVGAVAVGAVLGRVLFIPLQGTGLLTYVDVDVFRSRLQGLWPYWVAQLRDPAAGVLLVTGALLAVGCLMGAVREGVRFVTERSPAEASGAASRRRLVAVFLGIVPLGGLVATILALITHQYYFWPVLVLPYVLVLLAVPARTLPRLAVGGAGAFVAVAVVSGGVVSGGVVSGGGGLAHAERYFGYRTAETRCLDEVVPGQVGFATFSDARRLGLPSVTGIRLIPVTADLSPNLWLTNRAYSREERGGFFYVNEFGDERALDGHALRMRFGEPHREVACDEGRRIWIYDRPLSLVNG